MCSACLGADLPGLACRRVEGSIHLQGHRTFL